MVGCCAPRRLSTYNEPGRSTAASAILSGEKIRCTKEYTLFRLSQTLLAAIALLIYAATPPSVLAGGTASWYYNFVGPTEYYAGTTYLAPAASPTAGGITVAGGVPSNAVVSVVAWTYSLSRTVANQKAYFCRQSDNACIDISSATHGTSSAFAGGPANDKFWFKFTVTGTGTLSPAIQCGYSDQFFISYSY